MAALERAREELRRVAARVRAAALTPVGQRPSSHCAEIDCIRYWLPAALTSQAEQRADALDIGADEVLVGAGHLSELTYLYAQADALRLDFIDLDKTPREACPLSDEDLLRAGQAGWLPIRVGNYHRWAVARLGAPMRKLAERAAETPDLSRQVVLASPQQLQRFVERHTAPAVLYAAAYELRDARPALSAAWPERRIFAAGVLAAGLIALGCLAVPTAMASAGMLAGSAVFIAWSVLRLWLAAKTPPPVNAPAQDFPRYTVVAALYREADCVAGLVAALGALDYPPEKLQIILALEADDHATRDAVAALELGPQYRVVLAPASGPRGKPKALNAALPFVSGEFVVVYDAEDRPEPGQLREAVARFAHDPDGRLACVQARLTIDNSEDSWLTRVFTAEYAGQFDVLLPGLAARGLPILLGGSSNHLRTHLLREIGGWDPYNVTEDADLGIRLVRSGYRTEVAHSSTFEEAPGAAGAWIKQRTRWFKGWMQTWCVHMRHPLQSARELGARGFWAFQLFSIGTVFAALVQPIGWAMIAAGIWKPGLFEGVAGANAPLLGWFHFGALVCGYATTVAVAMIGLRRRRLLSLKKAGVLPLLMVGYWFLMSVAAWRALWQFFADRYAWEKTEHGLARTSRLRDAVRRLRGPLVKDTSSTRRQIPQAYD